MKTFKTIALLLVGTVSSLLLMGCGEIDTGTKTWRYRGSVDITGSNSRF